MPACRVWVYACAIGMVQLGCSGDDDANANKGAINFGNAPTAGTGATGTGASNGGFDPASLCPEGAARAGRVVPRVILVLDGSCSMTTPYPANGARSATMCNDSPGTRWAALRSALLDPNTGVVTRLQGVVDFGLAIFGTQPQCPITGTPIDPARNNLPAIDAAFGNAPPGMFTPAGLALDWVFDNMIAPAAPDSDMGPQIVLFATDGEPNSCDNPAPNYQPSVDAVTKGKGLNVRTYVVSLADSSGQFHDHLQQLADLGSESGSGTLYEPGDPQQLSADLELLIGGAVGCDLALNGNVLPGHECEGVVKLDGNALTCNVDYVLTDPRHIRLQGAACDTLTASPAAVLSADFPCDVFQVD